MSLLLLSCREQAARGTATSSARPAVPAPPAPAPAPAPGAASAIAAAEPLGFSEVPKSPSKESVTLNSDGLRAHRAQDYAKSAQLFQRAFTADFSHSLARFNAATALARLEHFDRVELELRALLQQDLPEYARRLNEDADLAAFRASPRGRALLAELADLERRWLAAAAEGVAGQLWRRHEPSGDPNAYETSHQRPEFVRFGSYNPKLGRFLPLVPRLPDALAALLDVKSGQAAVLHGRVSGCSADLCPRMTALHLLVLPRFAPATSTFGYRHAAPDRMAEVTMGDHVELELGADSARWRPGRDGAGWYRVSSASHSFETRGKNEGGERLGVGPYGSFSSGLPRGFALESNVLSGSGVRIPLPAELRAGKKQLVVSSDGKHGVLVASRASCECGAEGEAVTDLSYVVSRVSFETATLERWTAGTGSATARYGGDGSLYLQRGDNVERFAPGSPTPEHTPAGFASITPRIAVGDCCGL